MRAAVVLLVAAALSAFAFIAWLMMQVGQWVVALLPIGLAALLLYMVVRLAVQRYQQDN